MSKSRLEAVQETKAWIERNNINVLEERHFNDFDEYYIKDDNTILQVYISDGVQVVNELQSYK
jgi:hypothetical protein